MIRLTGVTKTFASGNRMFSRRAKRVTALNHISLQVEKGVIFGLVGESGSGKTTAGRLMVRLESPDQGAIDIAGQPIRSLRGKLLKAFRRKVQMIFQDPYQTLNPHQSVFDAIAEPLFIHHRDIRIHTGIDEKVSDTLTIVGLEPVSTFIHRYPHQLSGGQRQRVAIARAMVLDPNVLVADEPTSMLDASISVQIYQLLAAIQQQRAMTMVFITHSLAAANYLCDQLAVLYRGHIVETGPADVLISRPRHPYTQALIDALPRYGHQWSEKRFDTLRETEREATENSGCPFFSRCNIADEKRCGTQVPKLEALDGTHCAACFFA
jgi:oligopeptide/dipeptide ABC transporter ATP-binding protein